MLTEDDQNRLATKLSEIYGRAVDVKVSVAPGILGGVRVRVGSDLYDATVIRRLNDARTALVGRS
jgi:F-type H+-transporting ATPase subunit delta